MVKELFSHLRDNEALKSLVDERIYPQTAPKGAQTPYITYTVVDERDIQADSREVCAVKFWFQLDVYDKSYSGSEEVKTTLKEALYLFPYAYPKDMEARNMPQEKDTKLFRQLIEFKLKRMNNASN